jgi:hypothetical protein
VVGVGLTSGAAIVILGSFGPWVRSGARARSSYDVFELIDRLGFSPDGVVATAVRWWPVMPVLVVVATVMWWWGRDVPAAVVGFVAGGYAFATALAVSRAPDAGLISIGWGPRITMVGALVMVAASVAALVSRVRTRPRRRGIPTPNAAPPVDRS